MNWQMPQITPKSVVVSSYEGVYLFPGRTTNVSLDSVDKMEAQKHRNK